MSYEPRPGTVAYRALAYLENLPPGTEVRMSTISIAIDVDANNLAPCLNAAVEGGVVEKFAKPGTQRPLYYRLVPKVKRPNRLPEETTEVPPTTLQVAAESPSAPGVAAMTKVDRDRGALHAYVAAINERHPEPTASPEPEGLRIALWSDGELHIKRAGHGLITFSPAETKVLLRYLDRLASQEDGA